MNYRKSNALKVVEGRPAHYLSKKPIHNLATESPEPPESVTKDPFALAEWQYYVPLLMESGNLTKADRSMLASLCIISSHLETARTFLREGGELNYRGAQGRPRVKKIAAGPIVVGVRGSPVKNPFMDLAQSLERQKRDLCRDLGLAPLVRGLNVAPITQTSEKWDI